MDPIDLLMDEHRTIVSVLDALERWAGGLSRGADPARLEHFVVFFREYADAFHHAKEEDLLFATMVDHGFPRDSGPVGVMLAEHDSGRAHVRALAEHLGTAGAWTPAEVAAIAQHAHAFADLLRAHIGKEDRILYPMARRHLPADTLLALERAFQTFRHGGDDNRTAALVALADALAAAPHGGARAARAP